MKSAISRLGIYGLECASIDSFISANGLDTKVKRDIKLSNILGEKFNIISIIESKGRIEKIDDDGKNCGSVNDEVVDFIIKKINLNSEKNKKKINNLGLEVCHYTSDNTTEEFWDDWVNS